MKVRYRRIRLELAFTWAIARNSSTYKDNFIVELEEDGFCGYGEAAPNIRYNETPDDVEAILKTWQKDGLPEKLNVANLPSCLLMALDAARYMILARKRGQRVDALPGQAIMLPSYPVSFTIPIMPPAEIAPFFEEYGLDRFPYLKVKVGRDTSPDVLAELGKLYFGPVLMDGNEAFSTTEQLDACITGWQKNVLIIGLEQPFASTNVQLAKECKGRYPFPIYADESLTSGTNVEELATSFDGINIKLQKAGSYAEALRQKEEAQRLGLKIMVGCMVETSIGIWQGLQLAQNVDFVDLDSMLYLQSEPFGWVSEHAGALYPAEVLNNPFV
jgi:L-Ala-D/L-Glu epimerase